MNHTQDVILNIVLIKCLNFNDMPVICYKEPKRISLVLKT